MWAVSFRKGWFINLVVVVFFLISRNLGEDNLQAVVPSISSGLPNSHSWSTQGQGSHSGNGSQTSLGSRRRSGPNKNPLILVGWVITPLIWGESYPQSASETLLIFGPFLGAQELPFIPVVEGLVWWLLRLRVDEFQRVFWRVFRCTGCVSWWFLFSKKLMGSRVTFLWSTQTSGTICLRGKIPSKLP